MEEPIYIHVTNLYELLSVLQHADYNGYIWWSGKDIYTYKTLLYDYYNDVVIKFCPRMTYSSYRHFKRQGKKIKKYSEIFGV